MLVKDSPSAMYASGLMVGSPTTVNNFLKITDVVQRMKALARGIRQ